MQPAAPVDPGWPPWMIVLAFMGWLALMWALFRLWRWNRAARLERRRRAAIRPPGRGPGTSIELGPPD